MANNIIFNTKILRGAKGERGDAAGGDLPTNSVLYYDGDDTPEGFTVTSDPTGGGGGGGNSITYGYTVPSGSGNDGDLYYLLDSNNKISSIFLYMTNTWEVIEGNGVVPFAVYDNGVEGVPWTVSGGTKNADNIALDVVAGTTSNYAVTTEAIDITDYSRIDYLVRYRGREYNGYFNIGTYTGSKYISFTYLTDSSHNEVAIGLSDTQTGATTMRIASENGGAAEAILYYLSLN